MSVNSTNRAEHVTETDRRTLSYANMLADNIFGIEYKAPILVCRSYFDPDDYLATLVAFSNTDDSKSINLGLHEGKTREEALRGLLHELEGLAAEKSQRNTMDYWEGGHKAATIRQEEKEQAIREATTAEGIGSEYD